MPDSILVVEYEPRYTERVRQSLSEQPFEAIFAKDGEEALSLLKGLRPALIVLSSIIPKISTSELIRQIRNRPEFQHVPILITVSGYTGKNPKGDAIRLSASDMLPKPYSEGEFLNKVKQLVAGMAEDSSAAATVQMAIPQMPATEPAPPSGGGGGTLTSDDIFGEMIDNTAAPKRPKAAEKSLDDLLSQTLSGIQPQQKKKEPAAAASTIPIPQPAPAKPAEPKKKTSSDLDKLVESTLSGLEPQRSRPAEDKFASPKPAQTPAAPVASAPKPAAVPVQAAPAPVAPAPAPAVAPAPVPAPSPVAPPPPAPGATETQPVPVMAGPEAPPAPKSVASPLPPQPSPLVSPAMITPPPSLQAAAKPATPVPAKARDSREDEAEGGIRFGQYQLLEKIATGGMAEVWKARMRGVEGFQKTVAIKKILSHMSDNEEFVTMFVDEAKLAAQLNHNNIIHIYDLGREANSYYIAMEFIDGHDLKSILRKGQETGQPITVELALFIASKIAAALDYAHRKRDFDEKEMVLVHRDVSPQNVLISYEGDIKLCDFGIAKAASKASHTMAGALKGKLQYMSPEQAWGKTIDRRADIFALAAVLFEMLTGEKLFAGDSELSILEQVREARVRPPSALNDEVTPAIDAIVLRALAKNGEDRYQTAGEMARDLDQVLYSFRPTPTSADLAIFMHRIYSEVPVVHPHYEEPAPREEAPDELIVPAPAPAPVVVPVAAKTVVQEPLPAPEPAKRAEPAFAFGEAEKVGKKFPVVPVTIAAVVFIVVIGIVLMILKGKGAPSTPTATTTAATASAQTPAPAPAIAATATTASATASVPVTDTAADQNLINQEVQRRLAEEKAKLDKQRADELAKTQAATAAATPVTPPPQPAPVTPQPQPAQPEPAVTASQPREEPAPAPQPPRPAVPQTAKEGDLVPLGTPGLIPPTLVKMNKPTYPPMAKMQKVVGVVTIQALISEGGQVLDVKVLRGVSQNVGLNEAAVEAVRRSTFKPATKDGVRVKSYIMLPIQFKL